jgi:hypothetical protein
MDWGSDWGRSRVCSMVYLLVLQQIGHYCEFAT